jgi:hypothetical protein
MLSLISTVAWHFQELFCTCLVIPLPPLIFTISDSNSSLKQARLNLFLFPDSRKEYFYHPKSLTMEAFEGFQDSTIMEDNILLSTRIFMHQKRRV